MEIGTVLSITIGTGYRYDKPAVLLNCQLEDPEDIREVEYWYSAGNYSLPSVGDSVIIAEISHEYLVAIATNRDIQTVDNDGETSLFSTDNGTTKATLKLLKNGNIDLNNGDSSAVKFESLKTEFDKLKSDFNELVTAYNKHFHAVTPYIPPAIAKTTAPTLDLGVPTTADISTAKSESIRV